MNKLLVSPSPHLHTKTSTKSLMRDVVIALLPAVVVSVLFYGWAELLVLGVSVASCVMLEYLITRYMLKKTCTICDYSAVVTGILLALNLPASTPWWVVFIGAVVAIGVAKMTFGGLGQNLFNPAIVGRVFLLISFPTYMTDWTRPQGFIGGGLDALSGATPLANPTLANLEPQFMDMVLGTIPGSVGETSVIAILLGAALLIWTGVASWKIMVSSVIGGLAIGYLGYAVGATDLPGYYQLVMGGFLFGTVFMATDPVTSAQTECGKWIYGFLVGALAVTVRLWNPGYPEGMMLAILLMNTFAPLIDHYVIEGSIKRRAKKVKIA